MSISWKELKSEKYLPETRRFVEEVLDIHFLDQHRAHCPFHDDSQDSFRIYVDKKGEVRFHCFGECDGDWDVFDLIMKKERCNFRKAQERFASFLGFDEVQYYRKGDKNHEIEEEEGENAPDEPLLETSANSLLEDKHRVVLKQAAKFYSELLLSRPDKFENIIRYLHRRGVDKETIKEFTIGYCPPLEDEEFKGRALLNSQLDRFMKDLDQFKCHSKTSLLRLLNDEGAKGYSYYRRHIINSAKHPFGVYADYFTNRITFPVYDIEGQIEGIIGRRPDNRGIRWLKQTEDETLIRPKQWLYGIDKSARGIKEYQTVIIVEGIFDFFAFYNILENKQKPIVVSSLGARVDDSTIKILETLGAKFFIIAFDGDAAGMAGILRAAEKIEGGSAFFLGGLKQDEDPADKLKGVFNKISAFGIRHLIKGLDVEPKSGRPIMVSFLVNKQSNKKILSDEVLIQPVGRGKKSNFSQGDAGGNQRDFWYRMDDILPLLSYNHKNKADLQNKLNQIRSILEKPLEHPPNEDSKGAFFRLPSKFIEDGHYDRIESSLILHLYIAIMQQTKKRKLKMTDSELAKCLNTTRKTIIKYKNNLKKKGYLNINKTKTIQRLSVKYFNRNSD